MSLIQAFIQSDRVYPFSLYAGIGACLLLVILMVAVGPYSAHIDFLPDEGFAWYYWQLPERSTVAFYTAWGGYFAHQFFAWWVIAKAKRLRPKYKAGLHPINLLALAGNGFFILLHIAQTKLWYDGLAQTVSNFSAQMSVIFMLVIILIMETPRRGLFFGRKVPLGKTAIEFLRRYHGYYFSWAIIYTFWYHPIELTNGHILGFFYIFALLLQGSLFFTKFHRNRYWTAFLEGFVLVHGATVAYLSAEQGLRAAMMFFTGFLTLMVVTQIHGLGLSKRAIWTCVAAYAAIIGGLIVAGVVAPSAIIRIPVVEYGLVFIVALLLTGTLWLWRRLSGRPPEAEPAG